MNKYIWAMGYIKRTITKSMNMYIWAIGTLNELFIRSSCTQIKFSKIEEVSG